MAYKSDENVMELIWNGAPKTPDPEHVTMTQTDLEILWNYGFVDTDQYPKDLWFGAFEHHKQTCGNYILTKNELLEKDKYRFKGEILRPFDPLLINQGKYTDEGLQDLIDLSIGPSCSLPKDQLFQFFNNFKTKYRGKDKLIWMDLKAKKEIAELIYAHPSPTLMRELYFDYAFYAQMMFIAKGGKAASSHDTAKIQASTFATDSSNRSEIAARRLRALEKAREQLNRNEIDKEAEGTKLKEIKRSRKGTRG